MTDEDVQFLIAANCGDYPSSHMHGSAIRGPQKKSKKDFYDNDGLDIETDSDDITSDGGVDLNKLPDEDGFDSSI